MFKSHSKNTHQIYLLKLGIFFSPNSYKMKLNENLVEKPQNWLIERLSCNVILPTCWKKQRQNVGYANTMFYCQKSYVLILFSGWDSGLRITYHIRIMIMKLSLQLATGIVLIQRNKNSFCSLKRFNIFSYVIL